MKLIRGLHNIQPKHRHCVLTIGNFDGVHLGHRAVLSRVQESAKAHGVPAAVMIFEPQPLELFRPEQAPARLTRWREKYELMAPLGLEYLICTRFNHAFSQQPARYFIEHVLVEKLGVKHLVVGDDFRFGKGREGDFAMLQKAGEAFGFAVSNTASYRQLDVRVSSTLIREALQRGQFAEASEMLGHPFHFTGKVSHGEKNGRKLGFPTANLPLHRLHSPLHGVFAVVARVGNTTYQGVANIGYRPTFGGKQAQLEVHLFNFSGDLYGQSMRVYPQQMLREERKFESFDALREQIQKDKENAIKWFERHEFNVRP
ncbi:MAG: bifunctional riboflavin kinase / FMN adenylyltransferase RibF [Idiomarinaceae bacterium HL-53]|nr:MAG: bifunctional riboflavin kinase / FMN adenylyltransferase RibF [Idiomarinaceae bacterium HL-53]CUS47185.1 riboflavin kinase / FMN adenylyltransferase [Idiomarinaceae bacterium HL-53]